MAMRVEQQGHIEVQPTYQHVGYTSATVQWQLPGDHIVYFTGPLLAIGLLLLTAGLVCARYAGRRAAPRGGAIVLCVLATLVVLASEPTVRRMPTLSAPGYETLYRLEEACALTEEWEAELGRPPTPEEWASRMSGRQCGLDARGRPLRYEVRDTASTRDGQWYRISVGPWPAGERTDDGAWHAQSDYLGPDGLFGTPDDSGSTSSLGDWSIPGRYAHGREPRQ
jgi:hypothetical protein